MSFIARSRDSVAKTGLGILIGILIFIAAGLLATNWVAKMRREREEKKPRIAFSREYHRQAMSSPLAL